MASLEREAHIKQAQREAQEDMEVREWRSAP
jgi:hypothetical protein